MALKPPNINDPKTIGKMLLGLTGPGRIYNIADAVTEATTGTSITDRVAGAVTKPSTPKKPTAPTKPNQNAVGDAVRQAKMMRGIAPQTREAASTVNPTFARGDFDRAPNSKGGVVSYKSVFDIE